MTKYVGMARGEALLFVRRTYEDFASVWPNRKHNAFTEVLVDRRLR